MNSTNHNTTFLQYLQNQCQFSTKDVMFAVKNTTTSNDGGSSSSNRDNHHQHRHRQHQQQQLSILPHGNDLEPLPFHYRGGCVGYLGYEVRYDSQQFLDDIIDPRNHHPHEGNDDSVTTHPPPHHYQNHPSDHNNNHTTTTTTTTMTQEEGDPNVPSTAFIFADQSLVYDHWTQQRYLVGLSDHSSHGQEEVSKRMNQVKQDIQSMRTTLSTTTTTTSTTTTTTTNPSTRSQNQNKQPQSQHPIQFVLHQSRDQYQQDIDTCHDYIRQGESYEVCVTNQFEVTIPSIPKKNQDPFGLYMVLQHRNPAPFSAFFNFNAAPIHLHQCKSTK